MVSPMSRQCYNQCIIDSVANIVANCDTNSITNCVANDVSYFMLSNKQKERAVAHLFIFFSENVQKLSARIVYLTNTAVNKNKI